MPNILEILKQKHKEESSKIAKRYQVGQALGGLEGAKQFDDEQKSAILEIADTKGFKVLVQYEENIINKSLAVLAIESIDEETRRDSQRDYANSRARLSFFKNLADPNKK